MIKLIDIYSGNTFNPTQIKSDGYAGVIFKAGQGAWADVPRYKPDWYAMAGEAGLLRGWYWLADSRKHSMAHVDEMARFFPDLKALNNELGLWLDVEKPVLSWSDSTYWNKTYSPYAGPTNIVDIIYNLRLRGVNPGFYTSPGAWKLIFGNASEYFLNYVATCKLWTANYPWVYIEGVSKPTMYGKWSRWEFWQYREGPDINLYNGTDEQFWSSYNYQNPPPEPPVEPPVEPPPPVVITTERFARLRHDDPPRNVGLAVAPETVTMQDLPAGTQKGDRVPISKSWQTWLDGLNEDSALNWLLKVGSMWINVPYKADGSAMAEPISCGGNIVRVEAEQSGYARLQTLKSGDTPPAGMSYFSHPWLVQKATAVRAALPLTIYKVGAGLNVYFPLITAKPERWIQLGKLEYFPPLPCSVTVKYTLNVRAVPSVAGLKVSQYYAGNVIAVTEYAPRGGDVWGKTDRGWIALEYKGNYYTSWGMLTSPPPE